jgi:hypothetical protein
VDDGVSHHSGTGHGVLWGHTAEGAIKEPQQTHMSTREGGANTRLPGTHTRLQTHHRCAACSTRACRTLQVWAKTHGDNSKLLVCQHQHNTAERKTNKIMWYWPYRSNNK